MANDLSSWSNPTPPIGTGTVLQQQPSANSLFNWYNPNNFTGGTNVAVQPQLTTDDILARIEDLRNEINTAKEPSLTSDFSNFAQGVGSLAKAWLGFKSLGLSKDQYNFNKKLAQTNLANQANLTNQQLEGRYRTRHNIDPEGTTSAYGSLADYMKANAVKGSL